MSRWAVFCGDFESPDDSGAGDRLAGVELGCDLVDALEVCCS